MTLSLTIPAQVEAKLRERAAAIGEPLEAYASRVLSDAVSAPTIDEILGPVRADFARSGMSEDELIKFGRRELQALRSEKRARGG
jgi:hypothetical protein